MNDTADDRRALVEIPMVVWTASVQDPRWFSSEIAPRLAGTLVSIAGGYLRDPAETARDKLAEIVALCEAHVAGGSR